MLRTAVFVLLGLSFVLAIVSCESAGPRSESREPSGLFSKPADPPLSDADFLKSASAGPMKLQAAELILDNDQAYVSKMNALESARAGETVRMAYYIYTDDHSSSKLWKVVERKAREGVKFKIFADLIANMTSLELFRWLAQLPNVELRFFNGPSALIARDVLFLSKPCPPVRGVPQRDECEKAKWAEIGKNGKLDFYGKLMLTGMYAREIQWLTSALTFGAELDVQKLKQSSSASPDDRKKLLDFAKLLYQAKVKGDMVAMVKVALAMKLYSAQLSPVLNEVTGRLPVLQPEAKSFGDWEHVTDFTHHKFLSVGEHFLQLGGRNIENSYHMEHNPLIHRYIFDDVDLAVTVDPKDGAGFIRAYENLWNFSPMVMTWKQVNDLLFVDGVIDRDSTLKSIASCAASAKSSPKAREGFRSCLTSAFALAAAPAEMVAKIARYREAVIESRAAEYDSVYNVNAGPRISWSRDLNDGIPTAELRNARAFYVENLPYDKAIAPAERRRIFGAKTGEDLKSGKYIHYVWDRALEKTCVDNAKAREKNPSATSRVVFHSAYYLPSAQQFLSFAKMIDGTWNCGGVDVVILTNSAETTDMSWINFFSRYTMSAFFNVYSQREEFFPTARGRQAKFRYFDYVKQPGGNISLHAKTTVFGNDIMVGSANGDARSYFMDTNNSIYLQNVPGVAKAYVSRVDQLIGDRTRTTDRTAEFIHAEEPVDQTLARYHREDRALLTTMLKGHGLDTKVSPKVLEKAFGLLDSATELLYNSTLKIVAPVQLKDGETRDAVSDKYNRVLQLM